MRDAFGWDLDRYVLFGGYPGSAGLTEDFDRWRAYMLDALIETTLSRDVLLLTRVDKPALLRQLFRLGTEYSGQIVSYQRLVGQLQDAGNTTTLAHYLDLLRGTGLLAGLQKYAGSRVRQRGSSPKLLALDAGLMTAMTGVGPAAARADGDHWGRLVETAVGAHLVRTAGRDLEVGWWRDGDREVDYVLSGPGSVLAIEVASGSRKPSLPGLDAFGRRHPSRNAAHRRTGPLPGDGALDACGPRSSGPPPEQPRPAVGACRRDHAEPSNRGRWLVRLRALGHRAHASPRNPIRSPWRGHSGDDGADGHRAARADGETPAGLSPRG